MRRNWLKLCGRMLTLSRRPAEDTSDLISRSYDTIAAGYDEAWTNHMRDLSRAMLDQLSAPADADGIDLTCGTGFVTHELCERTNGHVVGVDRSAGMIEVAKKSYGEQCEFIQSDIITYLKKRPAESADVITCGWGLGYSKPWCVVREIARVLRPGGRVGIIDNSLFSLKEVLWASMLAFAEKPEALNHVMKVKFLPNSFALKTMMRFHGISTLHAYDGEKTYYTPDGKSAIARLQATGAAAGFEFATDDANRESIFARFAEVLEERYGSDKGVPITHRYLAAIGVNK